eukprot:3810265-Amphidinium_carterae.1
MLSGRSTMVLLDEIRAGVLIVRDILEVCREKLGLEDDGSTMELWHGSGERVPQATAVEDWPGIQPHGQIS